MTNDAAAHPPGTSRKQRLAAAAAAAVMAGTALALAGHANAGEGEKGKEQAERKGNALAAAGTFAPYVDTSLQPSYDLIENSEETGVKEYNLAFITSGGDCSPKWGGTQEPGDNPVAQQAEELRAKGGDVRISFGGAAGSELGLVCGSVDEPAKAYGEVVDASEVKKFAEEKNMSWLSMWSATRDKACLGGPKDEADPTCSSIEQRNNDFTKAFTG